MKKTIRILFLCFMTSGASFVKASDDEPAATAPRAPINNHTDRDDEEAGFRKKRINRSYIIESDDEERSGSEDSSQSGNIRGSRAYTLKDLVPIIKNTSTRQELADKLGVTVRATYSQTSRLQQQGLLNKEDFEHLNPRTHTDYGSGLVELIKAKTPLQGIYDFCAAHEASWTGNPDEKIKRSRLRGFFNIYYEKGDLTSDDTAYLKLPNTVIDRNGNTKQKILGFLQEKSQQAPTETLKELLAEFNRSDFQASREIVYSTFREHIEELDKKGRLSPEIQSFVRLCKDPDQARRALLQKKQ